MPFNGLGFSGGGFGQASVSNTAPLNQYLGAASSAQSVGVAQYGAIWASSNCSSCDAAIREMQTLTNTAARQLGIAVQIAADGKVGAGTVAALRQVAAAAAARGSAVGAVIAAYGTPEVVAKNADKIRDLLKQVTAAMPATAPTPLPQYPTHSGPAQFPMPGTGPAVPTSAMPGFDPGAAAPKSKLPYIIGGGILFVGIIAAGVILMTPKE